MAWQKALDTIIGPTGGAGPQGPQGNPGTTDTPIIDATHSARGIVQLTNTVSQNDTMAITPKGIDDLKVSLENKIAEEVKPPTIPGFETPGLMKNYVEFTTSGSHSWTPPVGVTKAYFTACAGGGKGVDGSAASYSAGTGGGGGQSVIRKQCRVDPLLAVQITVGRGGGQGPAPISATGGATVLNISYMESSIVHTEESFTLLGGGSADTIIIPTNYSDLVHPRTPSQVAALSGAGLPGSFVTGSSGTKGSIGQGGRSGYNIPSYTMSYLDSGASYSAQGDSGRSGGGGGGSLGGGGGGGAGMSNISTGTAASAFYPEESLGGLSFFLDGRDFSGGNGGRSGGGSATNTNPPLFYGVPSTAGKGPNAGAAGASGGGSATSGLWLGGGGGGGGGPGAGGGGGGARGVGTLSYAGGGGNGGGVTFSSSGTTPCKYKRKRDAVLNKRRAA